MNRRYLWAISDVQNAGKYIKVYMPGITKAGNIARDAGMK
jgi:hypothetical protein